jgi:hypothetical protein
MPEEWWQEMDLYEVQGTTAGKIQSNLIAK